MNNLLMRFPGGKRKALTLSYDDGVDQDIRLIGIMKKHGLKGTFNLNSGLYAAEGKVYPEGTVHRRMSKRQCLELYTDSGMEVAVHGYSHRFLTQLPVNARAQEVLRDREELEKDYGRIVRGMAYAFGDVDDEAVQVLKSCGIVYARTTVSTEKFDLPTDWLRMPATCHHNNPKLMELAQTFAEKTSGWKPELFYLWGHSYEFESRDNWNVIENFAEYMGGRDDIWYATNIEIYDYAAAYRQLQTSTDLTRVYNPSAATVWFELGGSICSIAPGECRCL